MTAASALNVYFNDQLVGTVYDTSPISFEYALTWLTQPHALAIANIPLQAGRQDAAAIPAFFENLLPEGDLRQYIITQKKATTLFSLLREVAGDTAGAFIILPAGQTPEPAQYTPTSWSDLADLLGKKSSSTIDIQGDHARISLAGAQEKISIALFSDHIPYLPQGTAPSTHILKPDIKRFSQIWHSATNETIIMLAAAHCGLPTAHVFYQADTQSCVVSRFDRYTKSDGSLGRIIQYDLCQLGTTTSDQKYEKEGGPGIAECAELIRSHSTQAAVDLQYFVSWIFFNLYTGNNDSHAKNLSMYQAANNGMVLTPFYDLMCTRLYPHLSQEFAFSIGGEVKPGSITYQHIKAMAIELNMQPGFVIRLATNLAKKMPGAIKTAVDTVNPSLSPSARVLAERLQHFVLSTTTKMAKRLTKSD